MDLLGRLGGRLRGGCGCVDVLQEVLASSNFVERSIGLHLGRLLFDRFLFQSKHGKLAVCDLPIVALLLALQIEQAHRIHDGVAPADSVLTDGQ